MYTDLTSFCENTVKAIKVRRMGWVRYVATIGKMRNAYKILVVHLEVSEIRYVFHCSLPKYRVRGGFPTESRIVLTCWLVHHEQRDPSATFLITNHMWTCLGLKQSLRSLKTAPNRLNMAGQIRIDYRI
jgi:hypothetical protein